MWVDYPLKSIRGHFKRLRGNLAFTKLLVSHAPMITECSRSQSHQTTQRHTHCHTLISSQLSLNKAQVSLYTGCHLHSDVPDRSPEGFRALDLLMTYTEVVPRTFALFSEKKEFQWNKAPCLIIHMLLELLWEIIGCHKPNAGKS